MLPINFFPIDESFAALSVCDIHNVLVNLINSSFTSLNRTYLQDVSWLAGKLGFRMYIVHDALSM